MVNLEHRCNGIRITLFKVNTYRAFWKIKPHNTEIIRSSEYSCGPISWYAQVAWLVETFGIHQIMSDFAPTHILLWDSELFDWLMISIWSNFDFFYKTRLLFWRKIQHFSDDTWIGGHKDHIVDSRLSLHCVGHHMGPPTYTRVRDSNKTSPETSYCIR